MDPPDLSLVAETIFTDGFQLSIAKYRILSLVGGRRKNCELQWSNGDMRVSTLKTQWYSQTRGLEGTTGDLYTGTVSTSIAPAELLERETYYRSWSKSEEPWFVVGYRGGRGANVVRSFVSSGCCRRCCCKFGEIPTVEHTRFGVVWVVGLVAKTAEGSLRAASPQSFSHTPTTTHHLKYGRRQSTINNRHLHDNPPSHQPPII